MEHHSEASASGPPPPPAALRQLGRNMRQLWVPSEVPRYRSSKVNSLTFLREHVAASVPAVITDLNPDEWPCMEKWSDEYLLSIVGSTEVSVNVTPNGFGDFVDDAGRFVKPCEEKRTFADFLTWVRCGAGQEATQDGSLVGDGHQSMVGIPYLSQQNDNLRQELPDLLSDVPAAVTLGVEAFGNEPDAINLWIGDERAVSSCHKDFYENLYVVVRGEKRFTLLPPAAIVFLHEQQCRPAHFERTADGGFKVVDDGPDEPLVPWIPIDVSAAKQREGHCAQYPRFAKAPLVEVVVGPGEMLYLPALWYHRVAQHGLTVAVNYWHDMNFGAGYVMYQYVRDVEGLDKDEAEENSSEEEAVEEDG